MYTAAVNLTQRQLLPQLVGFSEMLLMQLFLSLALLFLKCKILG